MFSLLKLTLLSSQTERLWHYYLLSKKFVTLKNKKIKNKGKKFIKNKRTIQNTRTRITTISFLWAKTQIGDKREAKMGICP